MNFLGKVALVLAFGCILFTLFTVINTPGALEQASRLDFPLTDKLDDAAEITMMLPIFLAIGATLVAFSQLKEDYGGRVLVLVSLCWLVLVGVIGVEGFRTFLPF